MADAAPLTPEEIGKLPHDDRGLAILLSHWLLTAAATVFLGLRVYCKRSSRKKLWWDDWILIAAWSTILATDIITTALVVEFKLGRHSWDLGVTPDNLAKFIILLSARASFTLTSLGWTKTAFAVTLLRLTEGFTRSFVWFIIISLNVTTIVSGLVPWIQCSPLEKTWNPALDGTCWAPKVGTKVWIGMGAYSALMDFTLAALPWMFLYHLALRNKEKFGILVAMSMGVIAGGVAIAKCAKLPQLGSGDSFNEVELYIWDITESTVTAMAACIPALRVLLRKHTSTRGSNSNSGGSGISGSSSHKYVHSISNVASPHSAITGSRPHIFHNDDLDTDHPDEFEFKTIPTFRTNITTASPTGPTAEDQRRDYESRFRRATREGLGHAGRNTDRGRQQQQPRGHEQQQQAGYFDLPPQPQPEPQRQSARPSPAGSSDPVLSGLRTRYEYPSSSSNETPTQVKNLD